MVLFAVLPEEHQPISVSYQAAIKSLLGKADTVDGERDRERKCLFVNVKNQSFPSTSVVANFVILRKDFILLFSSAF
jgi:hypothetical protein